MRSACKLVPAKARILAAMIAYLLLRLAARASRCALPALRFAELVGQCLSIRKPIARIDSPARKRDLVLNRSGIPKSPL
jgi:hypothetical protein